MSGLPKLWSELRVIADRRSDLGQINRLRAAHSALELARHEKAQARGILVDTEQGADKVDELRVRIEALNTHAESWYEDLSLATSRLRRELTRRLNERRRSVLAAFNQQLETTNRANRETTPRQLIGDVTTLSEEMTEFVRGSLEAMCFEMAEWVGIEGGISQQLDHIIDDSVVAVQPPPGIRQSTAGTGRDNTQSFYFGTMMGHVLATVAIGSIFAVSNPVGWIMAAGFGGIWAVRAAQGRGLAQDQAALRAWAVTTLNECAADIQLDCSERIDIVEHKVITTLRSLLPRHFEDLQSELAELERQQESTDEDRRAAIAAVEYQIEKIAILERRAERRLADYPVVATTVESATGRHPTGDTSFHQLEVGPTSEG